MHFEDAHPREDPAFLHSVKELFGRAKKKILNKDEDPGGEEGVSGDLNNSVADASFSALASAVGQEAARAIFRLGGDQSARQQQEVDPVTGVRADFVSAPPKAKVRIVGRTDEFTRERRRRLDRNKSASQVSKWRESYGQL